VEGISLVRRKLRDLERELREAGFEPLAHRGKGSHTIWLHEASGLQVIVPKPKGDLLPDYVNSQVKDAIRRAHEDN
jgi:predicted RNA binding protein YcfA (HicA-like mRNA interferase family)